MKNLREELDSLESQIRDIDDEIQCLYGDMMEKQHDAIYLSERLYFDKVAQADIEIEAWRCKYIELEILIYKLLGVLHDGHCDFEKTRNIILNEIRKA